MSSSNSDLSVKVTCICTASITVAGNYIYGTAEVDKFRKEHADCLPALRPVKEATP